MSTLTPIANQPNEQYAEYLLSDRWKDKRLRRLAMSNFACSACGSKQEVEIHHLTYARIFDEDMADLLPLCKAHHELAEYFCKRGILSKTGNPLFLASETVRVLIRDDNTLKSEPKSPATKKTRFAPVFNLVGRNSTQSRLVREEWFKKALFLKRKHFVKICRERFKGEPHFASCMSNACAIYERKKRHFGRYSHVEQFGH